VTKIGVDIDQLFNPVLLSQRLAPSCLYS